MSVEKERELFERYEHSKKPCANRNKLFEVFTKDGLDVDEYRYIGKYVCSFMQEKWELWQASANRQGYKLVPVDATQEIYIKYIGARIEAKELRLYDMQFFNHIYKAMIGAIE